MDPDGPKTCGSGTPTLLLTVETEANGDWSKWSTNERGPSLVGLLGSSCRYKRFLSCLGYSGQPSTTHFFSSLHTFSLYVSPSVINLGRQSCRVACLFLCVSGHRLKRSINNRRLKTEQWQVFLQRPHDGVDFNCTSKLTLSPVRRQKIRALYFLKVLVFSEGTFDDIYFFSLYVTYGTSKRSPGL
jgi:hypothetical protein